MICCLKCHGTGWYRYDWEHHQVCPDCCKHSKGWWKLGENHGKQNNGKWCCLNGCGKTYSDEELP